MREEEKSRDQVRERQKYIADQQKLRFMDKNVEDLFGHLININRYSFIKSKRFTQRITDRF